LTDGSSAKGRKELRDFGLVAGSLVAIVFGILFPRLHHHGVFVWPLIVGATLISVALIVPRALKPLFTVWTRVGLMLGLINSRVILTVLFFLVVFPMGAIMRRFRADPMARNLDRSLKSYRVTSRRAPREGMNRPF
jgi:hypothetical protein